MQWTFSPFLNKYTHHEQVQKDGWSWNNFLEVWRVDLLSTSSRLESQSEGISVILTAIKETKNKTDQNHTDLSAKLEANTSTLVKLQETVFGAKQEQVLIKEDC